MARLAKLATVARFAHRIELRLVVARLASLMGWTSQQANERKSEDPSMFDTLSPTDWRGHTARRGARANLHTNGWLVSLNVDTLQQSHAPKWLMLPLAKLAQVAG